MNFLSRLDSIKENWDENLSESKKKELQDLSEHMVETEKHHEREGRGKGLSAELQDAGRVRKWVFEDHKTIICQENLLVV